MSRKQIAARLVAEKAVQDVLADANQETRDLAREEYEAGDADSVVVDGQVFGRVRRDKATDKLRVVDWPVLEAWVREHVPHAWVSTPQVDRNFLAAVLKTGVYIDRETGELLEVPGLGVERLDGRLVVTTTPEALEAARQLLGRTLPELER